MSSCSRDHMATQYRSPTHNRHPKSKPAADDEEEEEEEEGEAHDDRSGRQRPAAFCPPSSSCRSGWTGAACRLFLRSACWDQDLDRRAGWAVVAPTRKTKSCRMDGRCEAGSAADSNVRGSLSVEGHGDGWSRRGLEAGGVGAMEFCGWGDLSVQTWS